MARFNYGGQALIEGVLMRGRDAIAVAFRHPDGRIVWASEDLRRGLRASRLGRAPFVRGLVVLYETLVVGTRWLIRSANIQAAAEGIEIGRWTVALTLTITLGLAVGVFFLLPLLIASFTTASVESDWVQHGVEGLIRVVIFLGYLALIARMPDIRRVFEYHGAEHMTIHALEAGDPLTTSEIRKYPTAHPRCGTEFLVVVILLSILLFGFLGRDNPVVMIGGRLVLIPVIAAVGYEILRFGARYRGNPIVRAIMAPGILIQMITTKQPSDDQIAVAIVSMQQALEADGEVVPEGSEVFDREPLELDADARAVAA
jgi:uncharacterized protein YqhQ